MNTNRSARQTARPHAATLTRQSARLLILLTLAALACGEARAQEATAQPQPPPREEGGPPPVRYVPVDVRSRLDAERDPKARARLGMLIAEECLDRAAQFAEQDQFVAATGQVGVYQAVVEDTIGFLHRPGRAGNKLRDIFKRVEITLRAHVPRLETIRRELPSQHAVYLKDAIDFVRDSRDQALGAFYDDAVIREPNRPAVTTAAGERATTSAPAQPVDEKKPNQQR
ncbi:MAG TPA: hypothetical protein VF588_04510 [Pyrinomonadaceae bacterium]|jgi:hypothetical protein